MHGTVSFEQSKILELSKSKLILVVELETSLKIQHSTPLAAEIIRRAIISSFIRN
jgi:hypothetical protein